MASYMAIEPEYLWKVEEMEGGAKLLTVATELDEVRIAWKPADAAKLSAKMKGVKTPSQAELKAITGGAADTDSGQGRS